MERVKKGEKYWTLTFDDDGLIFWDWEIDDYVGVEHKNRYEFNNYFHNAKEAASMAHKLRAVLKGADVIEMPSEEEIKASQDRIEDEVVFDIRDNNGKQLIYCTAINKGAELMADWFKNKIVK